MKKNRCPYCGNNPVPHRVWWYNESLNVVLTPLRQFLLYNPVASWFKRRGLDQSFGKFFLSLGFAAGVLKKQTDVRKCTVRRAQVLWEEAERRGINMYELRLFGKSIDTYVAEKDPRSKIQDPKKLQIPNSKFQILFSGLPRPIGYSNRWLDLMDDKWLLKKLFIQNHLPVPAGGTASSFREALGIFNRIGKPVIVKPRAGSRGRHSTSYIYEEDDLRRAFKVAQQLCHWVMVEEQLFGPVYRATIIGGPSPSRLSLEATLSRTEGSTSLGAYRLAGVLRGDPPQVIGDGRQSITQLAAEKNFLPHPGIAGIEITDQTRAFLFRQNLSEASVPSAGSVINLSEKIGVNYGGSSSEDFDICHPDNKELFLRAAAVLGDPILGFDFIAPDITKSWKQQKCGFIEVNTLPFINLHHDPLKGPPRNPAALVWDMLGWR